VTIRIAAQHHALPEMPTQRDYCLCLHGAPADNYRYEEKMLERKSTSHGWVHSIDLPRVETRGEFSIRIVPA
jgi:hypothetical protein